MFSGKNVFITGGGSGIGEATAIAFAENHANVVIVGRNENRLKRVANMNNKIKYMVCDVSDKEKVWKTIDYIFENLGKIDIVVNAAGVINIKKSDDSQDDKQIMDINFFGTFYVCERVIQQLIISSKEASIVNIASINGVNGGTHYFSYAASKGAVISYTKGIARKYGERGIRINAISPGDIITSMAYDANPNLKDNLEEIIKKYPLRRLGKPNDVANVVLFLASDKASFITGQNIIVDGGLTI